ncbi:hypothetical protein BJY14_003098 [Actinomadura luteofluorescens]|uniref:Uncharacterized protein n=1 Tax=Actinomadura luteofluorescens TaxID=46163 RepID=A0A7Y9EG41_9ACTN|nr:hypothetical protein [Actinomadura luteofluorescens]NYD47115.1 hypothetical protein [Actinomadura luteofluorescens]
MVRSDWPSVAYSPDGTLVWVYRPDAMARRGTPDTWVVLDTRSGTVRGQADVAFHECPSGDVVLSLPVGAFGHDPEDAAFDAHSRHSYDLEPLGDGSWLTTDPEGRPVRWIDRRQNG